MQDTAQWIVIAGWIAVGAVLMDHYKTALAFFVVAFALCMLPTNVPVSPGGVFTVGLAAFIWAAPFVMCCVAVWWLIQIFAPKKGA